MMNNKNTTERSNTTALKSKTLQAYCNIDAKVFVSLLYFLEFDAKSQLQGILSKQNVQYEGCNLITCASEVLSQVDADLEA